VPYYPGGGGSGSSLLGSSVTRIKEISTYSGNDFITVFFDSVFYIRFEIPDFFNPD
jgi:hypothetical protein